MTSMTYTECMPVWKILKLVRRIVSCWVSYSLYAPCAVLKIHLMLVWLLKNAPCADI